jgi:hypothetical protein
MTINAIKYLKKNTFKVHLIAFLLMIIPPGLLYFAAESGDAGLIWSLLGLIIAGNILVILVR